MERKVGTVSRGIRCPIIRTGDNLAGNCGFQRAGSRRKRKGFSLRDRDVVSVTESIVARAQGNYASVSAIAEDVRAKLGGGTIGVIFRSSPQPLLPSACRGIAMGAKEGCAHAQLPQRRGGETSWSAWTSWTRPGWTPTGMFHVGALPGDCSAKIGIPFTGVDYVQYYGDVIREAGAEVEIIFANDCRAILEHTKNVLTCDIHTGCAPSAFCGRTARACSGPGRYPQRACKRQRLQ